jgi:hypothetical protein
MTAGANLKELESDRPGFPTHGWIGLVLATFFWILNWGLTGPRTYWAFFPMWLGYCLTVDGLVRWRTGTSLLTRSWRKYVGLFVLSAPVWWLFEALNLQTQNWEYLAVGQFTSLSYAFWTTLSFSTVVPAVFGSAEFFSSFDFVRRLASGPVIKPERGVVLGFFVAGWAMLALMLLWPAVFFPFMWISIYFILEPVNIWLGHRSLADSTKTGDWRPVISLWLGVLLTAFFWEMWNYLSLPKWIYHVAWGNWLHVFEMPLLGYGGYLPFSLELFAVYHLVTGLLGERRTDFIKFSFQ